MEATSELAVDVLVDDLVVDVLVDVDLLEVDEDRGEMRDNSSKNYLLQANFSNQVLLTRCLGCFAIAIENICVQQIFSFAFDAFLLRSMNVTGGVANGRLRSLCFRSSQFAMFSCQNYETKENKKT